jgi:hypothetical protein
MSTGAAAPSTNGDHMDGPKGGKGDKGDGDNNIIVKAAGAVVAAGIAWTLFKSYQKSRSENNWTKVYMYDTS